MITIFSGMCANERERGIIWLREEAISFTYEFTVL